jgi:hypothetical protein
MCELAVMSYQLQFVLEKKVKGKRNKLNHGEGVALYLVYMCVEINRRE